MDVPAGVWIISAVVTFIVCYITFWITRKAYSKKWEDDE